MKKDVFINKMIDAVYIHVPFCQNICSYCDFCKMFYNELLVDQYLRELEKEVKLKYKGETIRTLYIGGGTPSCLNSTQLQKLFNITHLFNLQDDYEFTFECNIENINDDILKSLKSNRVNRLSIGVQTFQDKFLKYLNRKHNKILALKNLKKAKEYFDNINVDLMYAFKNQSLKDVEEDLDILIDLNIPHISTYSLIIEEHTQLFINHETSIDEDLDYQMYQLICQKLEANNFLHYEISNFSLYGYQSQHNLVYWNNLNYYGFGLGASGYIENVRYDNTKSINSYLKGNYIYYTHQLDLQEMIENEFILGLRKISGINKDTFFKKYHKDINDYKNVKKMLTNNKLVDDGKNIYINSNFLYLSNDILVEFLN